jgi:hypothetical protein
MVRMLGFELYPRPPHTLARLDPFLPGVVYPLQDENLGIGLVNDTGTDVMDPPLTP